MNIKRITLIILAVVILMGVFAAPVFAISPPDSDPEVISIDAYRNILETGDFLIVIYENTPYSTTPTDYSYPEAFVWRWFDTDGTTELAQSSGYVYQDNGYGYNVISFYLDVDDAPTWGEPYNFTLSGTPSAFSTVPTYTFSMDSGDYSSLTTSSEVKGAIADHILELATSLDTVWSLDPSYSLISEEDIDTRLSVYGQRFFRGAIYGIQAIAPSLFTLRIENIPDSYKTHTDEYIAELGGQHTGTYIQDSIDAGKNLLDVDYNLFGLLLILGVIITLIIVNWMIAGGMNWRGMVDAGAILVIGGRMALVGLGELALVAAICWLYVSAKFWRMI